MRLTLLQLRRIRAVNNIHKELPSVKMGHSVDEFFDMLLDTTSNGARLPNWSVIRRLSVIVADLE